MERSIKRGHGRLSRLVQVVLSANTKALSHLSKHPQPQLLTTTMGNYCVSIALLLSVVWLVRLYQSRKGLGALGQQRLLVQDARRVIGFAFFGPRGLEERLAMRAGPNQRLVLAFGIQNSFTTSDPVVHRAFLRSASAPLGTMTRARWQALYEDAQALLRAEVGPPQGWPWLNGLSEGGEGG